MCLPGIIMGAVTIHSTHNCARLWSSWTNLHPAWAFLKAAEIFEILAAGGTEICLCCMLIITVYHSVIIVILCLVTPPYFTFIILKCRRMSDVGIQLSWWHVWHHGVIIVWRKLFEFTYTLEFLSSSTQETRQVQDCKMLWIFKLYLYWPTFLYVIFCYCFYIWVAQLIVGVFYAGISFSCWLTFKWLPSFYFLFLLRYSCPAWLFVTLLHSLQDRSNLSSPAPHFKTSGVFLIYFLKCLSFSTIQSYCSTLLVFNLFF